MGNEPNTTKKNNKREIAYLLLLYAKRYVRELEQEYAKCQPARDAIIMEVIRNVEEVTGLTREFYTDAMDIQTEDLSSKIEQDISRIAQDNPSESTHHIIVSELFKASASLYRDEIKEYNIVGSNMMDKSKQLSFNDRIAYANGVALDFLNYVSGELTSDEYTLNNLCEKSRELERKAELEEFEQFLQMSAEYSERMSNGETVNDLFKDILVGAGVSKPEAAVFTEFNPRFHVQSTIAKEVDAKIVALVYAYAKFDDGNVKLHFSDENLGCGLPTEMRRKIMEMKPTKPKPVEKI